MFFGAKKLVVSCSSKSSAAFFIVTWPSSNQRTSFFKPFAKGNVLTDFKQCAGTSFLNAKVMLEKAYPKLIVIRSFSNFSP